MKSQTKALPSPGNMETYEQTSMPQGGFESATAIFKWPKAMYLRPYSHQDWHMVLVICQQTPHGSGVYYI
jgi:hypothetical protein